MTIRPTTRGGCSVKGACPYVSCRHHLLVDAQKTTLVAKGMPAFTVNSKGFDEWSDNLVELLLEAEHTCSLDVADAGTWYLEEIGGMMGISRERVRQIEETALGKLEGLYELRNRRENPDKTAMTLVSNVA